MRRLVVLNVALFGVPGAALNLGVGALRESAVVGLLSRQPSARLTVFDDGWGVRPARAELGGREVVYQLCGVRNSRRFHKRESYINMRLSSLVGGAGNPGLRLVDEADAVWDVSGGDSFSDIYGKTRFDTVTLPKELALRRGRPLVLLPQTYGPFTDKTVRDRARRVVARCAQAWARDADSFERLRELSSDDFDPGRHKLGVDLAFGLQPAAPPPHVLAEIESMLNTLANAPLAGLNVSGLLLNQAGAARKYGLTLDYRRLVTDLGQRLLASGAGLFLVPHVLGVPGGTDSDEDVTRDLHAQLTARYPGRVHLAPRDLGAGGRKWLIGQLDWFSGARMHATIGALSSGIPVAPVAYSHKFRGVFASCGVEDQVVDARALGTDEALERLWTAWEQRHAVRARLVEGLPPVLAQARRQMDEIVEASRLLAASGAST